MMTEKNLNKYILSAKALWLEMLYFIENIFATSSIYTFDSLSPWSRYANIYKTRKI